MTTQLERNAEVVLEHGCSRTQLDRASQWTECIFVTLLLNVDERQVVHRPHFSRIHGERGPIRVDGIVGHAERRMRPAEHAMHFGRRGIQRKGGHYPFLRFTAPVLVQ